MAVAVGVADGSDVAVAVRVAVGTAGDLVKVAVGVAVLVGAVVAVRVGVLVGLGVAVAVGVLVGPVVAEAVGVLVGPVVAVAVAELVAPAVVTVGVAVEGAGVLVELPVPRTTVTGPELQVWLPLPSSQNARTVYSWLPVTLKLKLI